MYISYFKSRRPRWKSELGGMPRAIARAAGRGRGSKYKIERVIGRGSFGTAYLVRSKSDSRQYVMKRLSLEHMDDKERAEALNECQVLMKLRRHPNVIRVHEHFEEDRRLCIVMDFADGGDLAQRVEAQAVCGTPFSEEQVLDWFVQASRQNQACPRVLACGLHFSDQIVHPLICE